MPVHSTDDMAVPDAGTGLASCFRPSNGTSADLFRDEGTGEACRWEPYDFITDWCW